MSTAHRLVLGTAGHIDHGKTALVGALTGVDTDRLPEEKSRGITIDLGFAPLDLGEGLVLSVVDVPGHEGLVRTMVAGATGIDLLLLVVAADEGVMPQTREHLAICELLGIRRAVVALTKVDAVDEETLALATDDVLEHLAAGPLADAPLVGVSARSGEGLDALREALRDAARAAPPRTARTGTARLPVDRVFAMKGFGTVVTGTLVGDALAVGDAVEVWPSRLRCRVRGLQRFGEATEHAEPGARCAVNLQGVEVAQLSRGDVVAPEDALAATGVADVELVWLPDAPPLDGPASVEFLVATAERRARLAPIGKGPAPGASGFARVHLDGPPLPLLPGDRFVVRGFARTALGGATLGGGRVLDPAPPRRRLSDAGLARDLAILARGDAAEDLRVRIARAGLTGIDEAQLRVRVGGDPGALDAGLASLRSEDLALSTTAGRWLAAESVARLEEALLDALRAFHAAEPLRPGMPRGALRGRLPDNVTPDAADLALERLVLRSAAAVEGDQVWSADHRVKLSPEDRALADRILVDAVEAALEPPLLREWEERSGADSARLREVLAHLERSGRLVRAPGDVFFAAEAVEALRVRVTAHLEKHGELTTPDYKSLIGTTRKWAVPLMELFDAEHLTRRRGDVRIRGRG